MTGSLLALLQLGDSAFPSGGFVHSHGLEQIVRDGLVRGPDALENYVKSSLLQSLATCDARACYTAAVAAQERDLDGVLETDRALLRTKAAAELRAASLQTGRRLVEESALHVEGEFLQEYRFALQAADGLGNYAVAFAVVGVTLGAACAEIPAALLLTSANAVLQSAMRLGCASHRDVQAALHRLRPVIEEITGELIASGPGQRLLSFHPLQEIGAMRHERAEARLFAS